MPLADFSRAFDLTSKPFAATPLQLNSAVVLPDTGATGYFLLRPEACSLTNTVRQTKDNIPQFNGSILHRRWLQGMEMTLAIELWETHDKIACDALANEMLDYLMGYSVGLLNAGDNEGRISWVVEGYLPRMLDDIRLLTFPQMTRDPGSPIEITMSVDTQYPYTLQLKEIDVPLPDSVGVFVTNPGNIPVWPVVEIGPVAFNINAFQLTNQSASTTETLAWLYSSPGSQTILAGDHGEMDNFRDTFFLNGSGANLSPGIDMLTSDFFAIYPGLNLITLSGADGTLKWNPGYA